MFHLAKKHRHHENTHLLLNDSVFDVGHDGSQNLSSLRGRQTRGILGCKGEDLLLRHWNKGIIHCDAASLKKRFSRKLKSCRCQDLKAVVMSDRRPAAFGFFWQSKEVAVTIKRAGRQGVKVQDTWTPWLRRRCIPEQRSTEHSIRMCHWSDGPMRAERAAPTVQLRWLGMSMWS